MSPDTLVMNVEIVENSRSEDYEDFEQLLSECFSAAYDETEISVSGSASESEGRDA